MNDFERCKRNHPSQQAQDERTIRAMQADIDGDPNPGKHYPPKPRMLWRF